jgi:hypothetical protein
MCAPPAAEKATESQAVAA